MMNSGDTSLQDGSCGRKETAPTPHAADAVEQNVERWSFDALYEEYRDPLYRYLVNLVTSPTQAEDLTQDVFVRVWRALPRMSADLKVSPWLYRIAKNIAIDALRRRRLIVWTSLDTEVIEKEDCTFVDPQMRYEGCLDEVQLALERMPVKTREMLVLYEVEGICYAQIAQHAQSAPGGVKMALTRARKQFKQHYQDVRDEMLVN